MKAEQFIKDYTRNCSNELCAVQDKYGKKVISYHEWLTPDQAERAVEIAREELVDKACEWLYEYCRYGCCEYIEKNDFIEDFRKTMEEL